MSPTTAAKSPDRRGRRVYSYVRVSTAREAMISPELQTSHNKGCAERESLEIVEEIPDLDVSGRDFVKRKIAWMIDEIRAGRADGVIVYNVSRWGRDLEESLRYIRELREAGGFLVSATEPVEENDQPSGKLALSTLLTIAQFQSDTIRAGWLSVLDRRRGFGLPNNTQPRFGYEWDATAKPHVDFGTPEKPAPLGAYVLDPERAPWLARAYRNFAAGLPLSRDVAEMNEAGVTSFRGARITYTTMIHTLDSGFGAGLIVMDARRGRKNAKPPVFLPGAHEPVIDLDTWRLYQARRKEHRAPRHVNPVGALTGLMVCASCGRPMGRTQDDGVFSFACISTTNNSYRPCARRATIREPLAIATVMDWADDQARRARLAERFVDAAKEVTDIEAIVKRLGAEEATLTRRIANVATMRADGELDREDAEPLIRKAEAERETLRVRVAELRTQGRRKSTPPPPDVFEALWQLLSGVNADGTKVDPAAANTAMRQVVAGVIVRPVGKSGGRTAAASKARVRVVPLFGSEP